MSKDGKEVLDDRLYTTEHDWVQKVGDKKYRVGITDFAQHELRDIYVIEIPKSGRMLTQGEEYGVIEAEKNRFDLKMPIEGRIVAVCEKESLGEINDCGESSTTNTYIGELYNINKKPYETWLIEIETNDESQLEHLLKPEAYREEIGSK